MIMLFLALAVFVIIVRIICTVQTKWQEKQRYFAMFARNVDTMMGTQKNKDMRCKQCENYIVTNEHAERLRKKIKVVKK